MHFIISAKCVVYSFDYIVFISIYIYQWRNSPPFIERIAECVMQ